MVYPGLLSTKQMLWFSCIHSDFGYILRICFLCVTGAVHTLIKVNSGIGNLGQTVKIENLPLYIWLVQALHIIHLSLTWNMSNFFIHVWNVLKNTFSLRVALPAGFCLFVFRCWILVLILLCLSSGDICDSTRKWITKSPNCWRISIAAAFLPSTF